MLTLTTSNSSHLRYIPQTVSQRQATVKFHGVFASHWKSLAFTPGRSFRETLVRDSGDLVIPFMQAGIQPARYYAHFCYFPYSGTNHLEKMADIHFCISPYIAVRVGLYLNHSRSLT